MPLGNEKRNSFMANRKAFPMGVLGQDRGILQSLYVKKRENDYRFDFFVLPLCRFYNSGNEELSVVPHDCGTNPKIRKQRNFTI